MNKRSQGRIKGNVQMLHFIFPQIKHGLTSNFSVKTKSR